MQSEFAKDGPAEERVVKVLVAILLPLGILFLYVIAAIDFIMVGSPRD